MGRILKLLVFLFILLAAGLTGFAFLGDLSPERGTVSEPVILDAY